MYIRFYDENGKLVNVTPDNPFPVTGGAVAMSFLFGTTDPDASIGKPEDVYFNTTTGDLFKNTNGTWGLLMNLRGPAGADGFPASQGAAVPDSAATDVAGIVADFNGLLTSLRTAGIIAT